MVFFINKTQDGGESTWEQNCVSPIFAHFVESASVFAYVCCFVRFVQVNFNENEGDSVGPLPKWIGRPFFQWKSMGFLEVVVSNIFLCSFPFGVSWSNLTCAYFSDGLKPSPIVVVPQDAKVEFLYCWCLDAQVLDQGPRVESVEIHTLRKGSITKRWIV